MQDISEVRHLQEHATLVAWVIDTLNDAVAGARTSLSSMQEAMGRVAEHAGEVLSASQQGTALIETMVDPRKLLVLYNRAAAEQNAAGKEQLLLWSDELLKEVNATF